MYILRLHCAADLDNHSRETVKVWTKVHAASLLICKSADNVDTVRRRRPSCLRASPPQSIMRSVHSYLCSLDRLQISTSSHQHHRQQQQQLDRVIDISAARVRSRTGRFPHPSPPRLSPNSPFLFSTPSHCRPVLHAVLMAGRQHQQPS